MARRKTTGPRQPKLTFCELFDFTCGERTDWYFDNWARYREQVEAFMAENDSYTPGEVAAKMARLDALYRFKPETP